VRESVAAAAVGFLMQPSPEKDSISAKVQEQAKKLPVVGNRIITAGLVAHFGNKFLIKNQWVGMGAKALLLGGMFEFGRSKLEVTKAENALLGDGSDDWQRAMDAGDDDSISGEIIDAE
jgi:hypothetical protein